MPKLKAAFFDWDGTLYDTYHNLQFENVANDLGWPLPKNANEMLKILFGKGHKEIFKTFFPDMTEEEKRIFENRWFEIDKQNVEMISGARALIHYLKLNGVLVGVVTHRIQEIIISLVKHNNLEPYIDMDFVQGRDGWKYAKPDPRVFSRILKKLTQKGIDIEQDKIIYVGDSLSDLECTTGHKIDFFGLTTGSVTKEDWMKAGLSEDFILERPLHLIDWALNNEYL